PLSVTEARDKEPIRPGNIYIAPGGYHLLVEKEFSFALSVDEPVCYSRPSIDVLFESAADACGPHLVGIILTGANSDGSDGIVAIKRNGGYTIAQDPATASSYYMPQSAIDTDAVDTVLPLDRIPAFVNELVEDANG
ncbi:MAG: chemotaxis protein CheB, partial [Desulfobacterales bacterium]|nr:chemotaxis protein CheB [Desulfobacterales bacterium]